MMKMLKVAFCEAMTGWIDKVLQEMQNVVDFVWLQVVMPT